MIQLNLLPQVKINFIKSQKLKRVALMVCIPLMTISILLVVFLAYIVYGSQKSKLSSLDTKAAASIDQLNGVKGLGKILTVQNQLNNLDSLHATKPITSRIFTWLNQLTPNDVSISKLTIDYPTKTITIEGASITTNLINQFADTLKFTTYTDSKTNNATPYAFSNVVLSNFSFNNSGGLIVDYTLTATFDPILFNVQTSNVKLVIPNQVTTRSQTENPDVLFKPKVAPPTTQSATNNVGGGN
jgi:hypothetical protein